MRNFIFLILIFHLINISANDSSNQSNSITWKDDWALADDFNMTVDSGGYNFPSEIAFLNNPYT